MTLVAYSCWIYYIELFRLHNTHKPCISCVWLRDHTQMNTAQLFMSDNYKQVDRHINNLQQSLGENQKLPAATSNYLHHISGTFRTTVVISVFTFLCYPWIFSVVTFYCISLNLHINQIKYNDRYSESPTNEIPRISNYLRQYEIQREIKSD